jgi:hypothetical protein
MIELTIGKVSEQKSWSKRQLVQEMDYRTIFSAKKLSDSQLHFYRARLPRHNSVTHVMQECRHPRWSDEDQTRPENARSRCYRGEYEKKCADKSL